MKIEPKDKSLLFSKTEIPDIFFTEYLPLANGDFVKVYLYLQFLANYGKDANISDLSKILALPFSTVQDSLKFWEEQGVIIKKTNGYSLVDLQEIELSKLYNPKITSSPDDIKLTEKSVLERLRNFDLILCGHTHNGMVPDFLNFLFKGNMGIISPRKNLFPKIAKGKIEKEINNHKITIIINGAITKLSNQSGKILSNLNFIYNKSVNKIIIRKKRGIKYE